MMKEIKLSNYYYILIVFFLLINVTSVVEITSGHFFNFALSDLLLPLVVFYILRKCKDDYNDLHKYIKFGFVLLLWITFSGLFSIFNPEIVDNSIVGLFEELLKTAICICYFLVGLNFLKLIDLSKIKVAWVVSLIMFFTFGIVLHYLAKSQIYIFNGNTKYSYLFMGTDSDPNHAATYFNITFIAMSIFAIKEKTNKKRSIFILCSLISIVGLLLTASRGGIISFAVGALLLIVYYFVKNKKLAILILLIMLTCIVLFFVLDTSVFESTFTKRIIYKSLDLDDGLDIRYALSKVAFMMGNDHSIFGVGRGNYANNSMQYFKQLDTNYIDTIPHNTYFGIYAEAGFIGLILFTLPFLLMIYKLIKSSFSDNEKNRDIETNIWIAAGIVMIALQAIVLNIENRRFIWFIVGVLLYILDHNIINHKFSHKTVDIKIRLRFIMISFFVLISISYYAVMNSYVPFPTINIEESYKHKLPDIGYLKDKQYTISLNLYHYAEDKNNSGLEISVIEKNKNGENTLLSQEHLGNVNGNIMYTFTPKYNDSAIYIEFKQENPVISISTFVPHYIFREKMYLDLTKWYFLKPWFIQKHFKKDWESEAKYVEETNLGTSQNIIIGNKLKLENVLSKYDHLKNKTLITIRYKVVNEIDKDFSVWLYGYPNDLHLIDKDQYFLGYEGYNQINEISTSQWVVGQSYDVIFEIPNTNGIYHLTTGFYYKNNVNVDYLYIKENDYTLELGVLNLDD